MWEVIDYKQEYFQEMLEMTIENYGAENDISNREFIQHEYFSNPDGNAVMKLAYDNDNERLAGQYIVIPRSYSVNGRAIPCVLSLNTLTRSQYRGQQVFTTLAEAVYEECKNQKKYFCYGAPNPNSYPGFVGKLDFCSLGNIPLYLKILSPFRLFCDKIHLRYKDLVSVRKETGKKKRKKLQKHSDMRIVKITEKNVQLFDVFWEKARWKYHVIGVRDTEYIKWRYLHMPLRNYSVYMVVQNHLPCGYVVGRVAEVAGMRCGMIVDFLTEKQNEEVAEMLLKKMILEFRQRRVGMLGCLMQKECEEARYLRKNGFFICPQKLLPQPFPVIFRQFHHLTGKRQEDLGHFSRWFFTMGDYDVI